MKQIGFLVTKGSDGNISVPRAYMEYLIKFGSPRIIYALDDNVYTDLDLLILPGGADVDAARYGTKPSHYAQNPNIQLEWWDKNMLQKYIDAGVPLFGICRGFQTLNVHFGGGLSQHIAQSYSTTSRGETVDNLHFVNNNNTKNWLVSLGFKDVNKVYKVNSLHHQGVEDDNLGKNLIPLLYNNVFMNIEAFISADGKVAGVQWHPEELASDVFSRLIISTLIKNKNVKKDANQ